MWKRKLINIYLILFKLTFICSLNGKCFWGNLVISRKMWEIWQNWVFSLTDIASHMWKLEIWLKYFLTKDMTTLGFSLNAAELSLNSVNSENLRNHWSMNWIHYKDLLCYLCLCGLVVSSLSLTQEILGSNPTILIFYFFVTEFSEFSENI